MTAQQPGNQLSLQIHDILKSVVVWLAEVEARQKRIEQFLDKVRDELNSPEAPRSGG